MNHPVLGEVKYGDRVRLISTGQVWRVVEYRGPLGGGGMPLYRVRRGKRPRRRYFEARADELEMLPPKAPAMPAPVEPATPSA